MRLEGCTGPVLQAVTWPTEFLITEERRNHNERMWKRLWQSLNRTDRTLQRDAADRAVDGHLRPTQRLTYNTARVIGQLMARCGITNLRAQSAVISLFCSTLLGALHLSREEAERAVLGGLAHGDG